MNKKHRVCAFCNNSLNLKACSRCEAVFYCSQEHQKKDWKEGRHKDKCAALASRRKGNESLDVSRNFELEQANFVHK